ncbi:MAG: hypothetical protein IPK19_13755 [Chloroflexi bacterium]|nr:hypothetical protein [Chloroflexota bacterium]
MSATLDTHRAIRDAQPTPGLDSADRTGVILLWATVLIAIITAVLALLNAVNWTGQPFLGAVTTRTLVVDSTAPIDLSTWPGLSAGLQTGDRLTAINEIRLVPTGDPTSDSARTLNDVLGALAVGDRVTVEFLRPTTAGVTRMNSTEVCADPVDELAPCTLSAVLERFPESDFLALFLIPFVSGIIALIIGIALMVARSRVLEVRLGAAFILMYSIFATAFFDLNTTQQLTRLWLIGTVLMGSSLLSLGMVFPIPLPITRQTPWARYLPVLIGMVMAAAVVAMHDLPASPEQARYALWLAPGVTLAACLLMVYSLLRRRNQATSQLIRDQINTLILGCALGLLLGVVWLVNVIIEATTALEVLPLNTQSVTPFLLASVLSIAYAVTRRRASDTDRLISQSLAYTILLIALIVGYGMLVLAASLIARETVAPNNPVLIAITVFFVALLFVPLRTRLQARIDRIYFRRRANYASALEAFSRNLGTLAEIGGIASVLRHELDETLQPEQTYIFLRDPAGGVYAADGTDIIFAESSPMLGALRRGGVISLAPGQAWDRDIVGERPRLNVLAAQVIAPWPAPAGRSTASSSWPQRARPTASTTMKRCATSKH